MGSWIKNLSEFWQVNGFHLNLLPWLSSCILCDYLTIPRYLCRRRMFLLKSFLIEIKRGLLGLDAIAIETNAIANDNTMLIVWRGSCWFFWSYNYTSQQSVQVYCMELVELGPLLKKHHAYCNKKEPSTLWSYNHTSKQSKSRYLFVGESLVNFYNSRMLRMAFSGVLTMFPTNFTEFIYKSTA